MTEDELLDDWSLNGQDGETFASFCARVNRQGMIDTSVSTTDAILHASEVEAALKVSRETEIIGPSQRPLGRPMTDLGSGGTTLTPAFASVSVVAFVCVVIKAAVAYLNFRSDVLVEVLTKQVSATPGVPTPSAREDSRVGRIHDAIQSLCRLSALLNQACEAATRSIGQVDISNVLSTFLSSWTNAIVELDARVGELFMEALSIDTAGITTTTGNAPPYSNLILSKNQLVRATGEGVDTVMHSPIFNAVVSGGCTRSVSNGIRFQDFADVTREFSRTVGERMYMVDSDIFSVWLMSMKGIVDGVQATSQAIRLGDSRKLRLLLQKWRAHIVTRTRQRKAVIDLKSARSERLLRGALKNWATQRHTARPRETPSTLTERERTDGFPVRAPPSRRWSTSSPVNTGDAGRDRASSEPDSRQAFTGGAIGALLMAPTQPSAPISDFVSAPQHAGAETLLHSSVLTTGSRSRRASVASRELDAISVLASDDAQETKAATPRDSPITVVVELPQHGGVHSLAHVEKLVEVPQSRRASVASQDSKSSEQPLDEALGAVDANELSRLSSVESFVDGVRRVADSLRETDADIGGIIHEMHGLIELVSYPKTQRSFAHLQHKNRNFTIRSTGILFPQSVVDRLSQWPFQPHTEWPWGEQVSSHALGEVIQLVLDDMYEFGLSDRHVVIKSDVNPVKAGLAALTGMFTVGTFDERVFPSFVELANGFYRDEKHQSYANSSGGLFPFMALVAHFQWCSNDQTRENLLKAYTDDGLVAYDVPERNPFDDVADNYDGLKTFLSVAVTYTTLGAYSSIDALKAERQRNVLMYRGGLGYLRSRNGLQKLEQISESCDAVTPLNVSGSVNDLFQTDIAAFIRDVVLGTFCSGILLGREIILSLNAVCDAKLQEIEVVVAEFQRCTGLIEMISELRQQYYLHELHSVSRQYSEKLEVLAGTIKAEELRVHANELEAISVMYRFVGGLFVRAVSGTFTAEDLLFGGFGGMGFGRTLKSALQDVCEYVGILSNEQSHDIVRLLQILRDENTGAIDGQEDDEDEEEEGESTGSSGAGAAAGAGTGALVPPPERHLETATQVHIREQDKTFLNVPGYLLELNDRLMVMMQMIKSLEQGIDVQIKTPATPEIIKALNAHALALQSLRGDELEFAAMDAVDPHLFTPALFVLQVNGVRRVIRVNGNTVAVQHMKQLTDGDDEMNEMNAMAKVDRKTHAQVLVYLSLALVLFQAGGEEILPLLFPDIGKTHQDGVAEVLRSSEGALAFATKLVDNINGKPGRSYSSRHDAHQTISAALLYAKSVATRCILSSMKEDVIVIPFSRS